MNQLDFQQMASLEAGNFVDGMCAAVSIFSAGWGIAVLAGATVATGGFAAWAWGVAVVGCSAYGIYQIVK